MSIEFLQIQRDENELSRDSFLEKLCILTVCYFCMSTEMRFLLHSRGKYLKPEVKEEREIESEYWHAKSLEIACTFLPTILYILYCMHFIPTIIMYIYIYLNVFMFIYTCTKTHTNEIDFIS